MSATGGMAGEKTLVVFFDGSFVERENGSHVRFFELLAFAARRFRNVVLYSYSNHPTCPWTPQSEARFRALFPSVKLVLEPRPSSIRWLTRLKNAAVTVFPKSASRALGWRLRGATPAFEALVADPGKIVLMLNFVDSAPNLNGLPPAPIVLETHDVKFLKHSKRYGQASNSLRVLGKLRSEVAVWHAASALIAISPVDATLMKAFGTDVPVFYVPAYDTASEPAQAQPAASPKYDLLFVGANNVLNASGLRDFLLANRDWLEHRTLAIAGRVSENPIVAPLLPSAPFCSVLGFQQDLAPLYAQSRLVVSPVEGTGLKMKVVEALAHGKPVCGSAHSIDALPPGHEACVFPLTRTAVEALLDDPVQLRNAETAALAYHRRLSEAGELSAFARFLSEALHG